MKQRRNFCKRLLTFVLSLAMVLTSVNISALTVQAAQTPTDGSLTKPFGVNISYNATDETIDVVWGNAGDDYAYCVSITGQDTSYEKVYDNLPCAAQKISYEGGGSWETGKTYLVELQSKKDGSYSEAVSESITISDSTAGGSTEGGTEYGGAVDIPAKPFGVVAEYWANEDINKGKIRIAWGDASDAAKWTISIDGEEVGESKESVYFAKNDYAAGTHTVKLIAVNEAGKSAPETVYFTLTAEQAGGTKVGADDNEGGEGTGDGNEGGGEQPTEAPGKPFGLVIGFEQNNTKISLVWGMPALAPDGWRVYIDDILVGTAKAAGGNLYDNIYSEGEHTVKLVAYNSIGDSEPLEGSFILTEEQAGDKGIATEDDKKSLKTLYEQEKTFSETVGNEEKYTVSTWTTYTKSIDTAKTVLDNKEATKKQVNEAYNDLLSAKDGLKEDTAEGSTVVVSEQLQQAFVGNNVVLTYAANTRKFNFNNYTVKINGKATSTSGIIVGDSTITLPAGLFPSAGDYTIQFEQSGCTFSPVYQKIYATGDTDKWNLIWNDEFNGTALDKGKWDYQTGTGSAYGVAGWGNSEEEYYTSDSENSSVGDGTFTITAKKDGKYGTGYTSARIRTVTEDIVDGKADKGTALKIGTYGKVEAKIKMPAGDGIWPAFWMLPYDSEYGTWATSGELDIMEARGRLPGQVCGTIHYGAAWPNNVSNGSDYYFPQGSDYTDYHIYGVEWDPTAIRWYVDGEVYNEITNWYALSGEEGNWPYPAPFDENFYVILNLAVGGTFDSDANGIAVDEDGVDMDVDYVRWYQRDEEVYKNWEIKAPETDKDNTETAADLLKLCDADGNFIKDSNFTEMNTTPITKGDGWNIERGEWFPLLIPENGGGQATWSKIDNNGTNYLKVAVTNAGSQTYSSQMLQYFPVVKGYSYEISYMAYTDTVSTKADVSLKIGGDGDNGWGVYSGNYTDALTTTPTLYTHKFTMNADTDPTARFEFNLATSSGNVYLSNVAVRLLSNGIDESDGENNPKAPLADGNHVYNGGFNIGSDNLLYWHWTGNDDAAVVKSGGKGNRVADITVTGNPVSIWQYGINLLQKDHYILTFDADTTAAQDVTIAFTDADGNKIYATATKALTSGVNKVTYEFNQPEGMTDTAAKLMFTFPKSAKLDNVKLIRTTNENIDWDTVDVWPIYNGDFFNGKDGWNIWHEGAGWHESDSVNDAGQLVVKNVNINEGGTFYCLGVQSPTMTLAKGLPYRVKFDYTLPAAKDYTLELAGEQREITLDAGTHTYISAPFKGAGNCQFTLYLGPNPTTAYDLILDNVVVYLDPDSITVPDGFKKPVSLAQDGRSNANGTAIVKYSQDTADDTAAWESAAKTYYVDGKEIDASKVAINTVNKKITIDGSVFPEAGTYRFALKAEGYAQTKAITLTIMDESGNLLVNGNFSGGTDPWSFYLADWTSGGSFSVNEDGVAVVEHNWDGGESWHFQLSQDNLEYDAGDYAIIFDAWADVERPIGVQLKPNSTSVLDGTAAKVSLTTEPQNYLILWKDLSAASGITLNFELGSGIAYEGLTAPNKKHNIYIDNVIFRKATQADLNSVPGVIAVEPGAAAVGDDVKITYVEATDVWKESAKTVYVNQKAVAEDLIDEDENGLTIDGSVFPAVGRYAIYIVSEGCRPTATVYKNVLGADGNRIIGGNMNDASLWGISNEDAENLSNGTIAYGVYTLDYNGGYFYSDRNCWVTWSSQLIKENISVEAGKSYTLMFEAETDLEGGRDILIELNNDNQNQISCHINKGTGTYKVVLPAIQQASDEYLFKLLLGPVGDNLQLDTSNGEGNNVVPHTLILDNFAMLELEEGSVIKITLGNLLEEYAGAKEDAEFSSIYEAAEQVYQDDSATQEEVDAAVADLRKGYLVIAKAGLADVIAKYADVDGDDSNKIYQAFKKAYEAAVEVNERDDVTQTQIAKAIAELENAYDVLMRAADLEELIAEYENLEQGNYTDDSWKAFTDALQAAKDILQEDNVTLNMINEAIENLEDAHGALTDKDLDVPDELDKSALNAILAKYADVDGDETDANYQAFKAAYDKAKALVTDNTATQTDVDNAVDAVKHAYLAYVKALLETDVAAYEDMEQGAYTEDTWIPFQDALANAKKLLADTSVADAEAAADTIVEATEALEAAHRALKREGLWIKAIPNQTYTGSAIKPSVEVWEGEQILTEKKDYTVSYKNNTKAGTAQVIVKGKGNYNSQDTVDFTILPKNMEELDVADVYAVMNNKGKVTNPKITVKYGKKTVTTGNKKDCTITYPDVTVTDEEGNTSVVPGVYKITIEAKKVKVTDEDGNETETYTGNYTGKKEINYTVLSGDTRLMSKAAVTLSVKTVSYAEANAAEPVTPAVTVTYGSGRNKETLEENVDYTLHYVDSNKVGKATVEVTAITKNPADADENTKYYYGTKTAAYTVTGDMFKTSNITIDGFESTGYTYCGDEIKLDENELVLKDNKRKDENDAPYTLVRGKDYEISYSNNTNAGRKAAVIFEGMGSYAGSKITKNFTITPLSLESCEDEDSKLEWRCPEKAVYTKTGAVPEYTLSFRGEPLTVKTDYAVSYSGNKIVKENESSASITIKGKGNFSGTLIAPYEVRKLTTEEINAGAVYAEAADIVVPVKAANLKASLKVYEKSTGKTLAAGTDYDKKFEYRVLDAAGEEVEVTAGDLVPDKNIIVSITLKKNYSGTDEEAATIKTSFRLYDKAKKASGFQVVVDDNDGQGWYYTGQPIEPKVTVYKDRAGKSANEALVEGVDYKVVGYTNNTQKGKAKIIIAGIGNGYGGTKTVTFKIKNKPMSIQNTMKEWGQSIADFFSNLF